MISRTQPILGLPRLAHLCVAAMLLHGGVSMRLSAEDAPLDIQRAKALFQKKQSGGTLTQEEEDYLKRARQEMQRRSAAKQNGVGPASSGTAPVADPKMVAALVPLDELTGTYKGEDGGLYGGGKNQIEGVPLAAYEKASRKIQPLDGDGKPSADGKIVLISIGMSNTTMEFSKFVETANADEKKSAKVVIVDGAIGARTGVAWALDGADLLPAGEPERLAKIMEKMGRPGKGMGDTWKTLDKRLQDHSVTPQQVQALWIKQAEARPAGLGEFPEHAHTLEADVIDILNIAKKRFPNLQVAFLSSRIFAGYATSPLNPEPFAYEGAFAMRWVIQDQMKGEPRLNADPGKGEVKAPVVLWGPYLWANGKTPRKSDGLTWNEEDFVVTDHTHPSTSARQKVAGLLLKFFETDPSAQRWFVKEK